MTESEFAALRERAARGDPDAVDELIELAGEHGDLAELRRLSDLGNTTATDELIQLASEHGDLAELRRLSDLGNTTATDELIQLASEHGDLAELRRLSDLGNSTATDELRGLEPEVRAPCPTGAGRPAGGRRPSDAGHRSGERTAQNRPVTVTDDRRRPTVTQQLGPRSADRGPSASPCAQLPGIRGTVGVGILSHGTRAMIVPAVFRQTEAGSNAGRPARKSVRVDSGLAGRTRHAGRRVAARTARAPTTGRRRGRDRRRGPGGRRGRPPARPASPGGPRSAAGRRAGARPASWVTGGASVCDCCSRAGKSPTYCGPWRAHAVDRHVARRGHGRESDERPRRRHGLSREGLRGVPPMARPTYPQRATMTQVTVGQTRSTIRCRSAAMRVACCDAPTMASWAWAVDALCSSTAAAIVVCASTTPCMVSWTLSSAAAGGLDVTPDGVDDPADPLGGLGRLPRQVLDLARDDGEALARLAGPGGLDGGVQRQQVRLVGDGGDAAGDLVDLGHRAGQALDGLGALAGAGAGRFAVVVAWLAAAEISAIASRRPRHDRGRGSDVELQLLPGVDQLGRSGAPAAAARSSRPARPAAASSAARARSAASSAWAASWATACSPRAPARPPPRSASSVNFQP